MPARKPERSANREAVMLLRGIWGEINGLNRRIDRTRKELSERIDQTNQRLDQLENAVEQFPKGQTEAEIRLATELLGVGRTVGGAKDLSKDRLDLRHRPDDLDRRLPAVAQRRTD